MGEVTDSFVLALDIFATVVEIAGFSVPTDRTINSRSLLGFVDTTLPTPSTRSRVFSELKLDSDPDRYAIKKILTNGKTVKYINNEGTNECYLLTDDPSESNNIYGESVCNSINTEHPGTASGTVSGTANQIQLGNITSDIGNSTSGIDTEQSSTSTEAENSEIKDSGIIKDKFGFYHY